MSIALVATAAQKPTPEIPGDLFKTQGATFAGGIGAWAASGTGTTVTYDSAKGVDATHGSVKVHTTTNATDRYGEVVIPGTFKAGVAYHLHVLVQHSVVAAGEAIYYITSFGDIAAADNAVDSVIFKATDNDTAGRGMPDSRRIALIMAWTPSADRTAVKFRVSRNGALNASTSDLWLERVRVAPVIVGYPGLADQRIIDDQVHPNTRFMTLLPYTEQTQIGVGIPDTGYPYSQGFYVRGTASLINGPVDFAGDSSYIGTGLTGMFAYNNQKGGGARRTNQSYNEEFGPDYVGWNRGQRSPTEASFYPDGDYDIYFLDGAFDSDTRHWWHEEADGAYKASAGRKSRLGLYFEKTFNLTGGQTTGTGKNEPAQYWQLPFPTEIDEVRVHLGTVPTGATFIVDVNVAGTTIFTTQANRPTVAISASDATSGAPDTTKFTKDSRLSFDIDQVGSTIAGSDLFVQVRGRYLW